MNKLQITKTVVRFVAGTSVSACVQAIVKNQIAPENIIQKTEVVIGSITLGAMAAQAAGTYTDRFIDELGEAFTSKN